MMFESVPDKLLFIMVCVYNFVGILCAIEAVPYAMKIAIQLAILLMVVIIGELQSCVTM